MGLKVPFLAGASPWQRRNARLISDSLGPRNAVNHGIVTGNHIGMISEFLIVGCDHGWLVKIGYDRRRFEHATCRVASRVQGFFGTDFALSTTSAGTYRNRTIEQTGSKGRRRQGGVRRARATPRTRCIARSVARASTKSAS